MSNGCVIYLKTIFPIENLTGTKSNNSKTRSGVAAKTEFKFGFTIGPYAKRDNKTFFRIIEIYKYQEFLGKATEEARQRP